MTLDLKGYRMGSLNEALSVGLNEALPGSLSRRVSDGKDTMKGA